MFSGKRFLFSMLLLSAFLVSPMMVHATETVTQVDLIFDASGSMWGQIDGKTKIEIARETVSGMIDELSRKENLRLALRVYGHQNKQCTNSVCEVPMGVIDADAIKGMIDNIKPLGKTPITFSLTQAVNDFDPDVPGEKVIILITDGIESCDADPCEAARKLQEAGIVTKIHVVGFGLGGDELDTLRCISEPSGGLVVGADDADDLTGALEKIVQQTLQVNLEIRATNDRNENVLISYEVFRSGEASGEVIASGDNSMDHVARLFLAGGTYDIKVTNQDSGDAIWFRQVTINEDSLTQKMALFAQRTLTIKIRNAAGEFVYGDVYIYDKAGNEIKYADTSMGSQAVFTVLPGIYDIKGFDAGTRKEAWLKDVDVTEQAEFAGVVDVK